MIADLFKSMKQYIKDEWMDDIADSLVKTGEHGLLNINIEIKLGSYRIHTINIPGPLIKKNGEIDYDPRYWR